MASEVALGRVGLILAIEVSRLARNNADWYRLLDFCGMTDTLRTVCTILVCTTIGCCWGSRALCPKPSCT
jgi:hypothetical protein